MGAKAVITTPFPTVQETAREMGVAAKRVRLLRKLMAAITEGKDDRLRIVGGTAALKAQRRPAGRSRVTKRKQASRR